MLNIEDSILIIIDVQEKLIKATNKGDICAINTAKLLKAATILNIPSIITEQYPKGLGNTSPLIIQELSEISYIFEKTSFSIMNEPEIKAKLDSFNQKQIILCGIETHICVLQTAIDLLKSDYEVHIVKDAVSSRKNEEYEIGLKLLKQYGAKITSLEIILFEWLKSSKHPYFKQIQALIK